MNKLQEMNAQKKPPYILIQELIKHIDNSGITQDKWAEKASVSQSTISRVLSSTNRKRVSKPLTELCNYAGIDLYYSDNALDENKQIIIDSINQNWIGTKEQAIKIAAIIKSISAYV